MSTGYRITNGYLKEAYFTGTHEDAIHDVLNRKADIGAAKNTVFQRLAKADPRIMKELVVLERSPDVPENALALRKDIDASVRDLLKDALLKMHLDPDGKKVLERFGALKFIETTNKDYDVVREIRGRYPPEPGHLRLQERLMKRKIVIGLAIYSVVFLLAGVYVIRTIRNRHDEPGPVDHASPGGDPAGALPAGDQESAGGSHADRHAVFEKFRYRRDACPSAWGDSSTPASDATTRRAGRSG